MSQLRDKVERNKAARIEALDQAARDMVAQGRGTVDPTGRPTIGVDVREEKPVPSEKPWRKAFALEHVAPGLWCMASLHYDENDNLRQIVRTEPNVKAIAVNELKMTNAKHWMTLG